MHSAPDAWSLLEPWLAPLAPENVARQEALGRVLAAAPRASVDVPPSDVSAMDGYALAGAARVDETVDVRATVAAGDPPGVTLAAGEVARIMTGAPIPLGADRVVPVELTHPGDGHVVVLREVGTGANIRRQGEIQRAGDDLLPAGAVLSPGGLALLATHGIARVSVYRPPRVAVLATGDELVPPEAAPGAGQIRNSHADFLLAAGRQMGLRFSDLGIGRDDRASLRAAIQKGLNFDVLLLSGGVSMGAYDLVEGVLADLGAKVVFDGVAIQPGRPLIVFRHAGGLVFGLPGNPGSAMVGFWLFARPALRCLMGEPDRVWGGALTGELVREVRAAPRDRDRLVPAEAWSEDGRLLVAALDPRGSHDVAAFARGNALLRLPAGASATPAGGAADVLLLGPLSSNRR